MFCKRSSKSQLVSAFASASVALMAAGDAVASQGPGGGFGSASTVTQLAMAIVVYGGSAGSRRGAPTLIELELAGPPEAVHAGRDDCPAWPKLLHVSRRAIANRIAARKIARVNVVGRVTRIDPDPRRRTAHTALCREIMRGRSSLRELGSRSRDLRPRGGYRR